MKKLLMGLLLASLTIIAAPADARNATQQFGNCLVDNLNGKERKKLAKWIFFAMAAHPEIASFANISNSNIKESDQAVGNLITRLLTNNCADEMKAAYRVNPQAIEQGFELVGQVAMQELMTNDRVMQSITNYGNYTDQDKINKLLVD